MIQEWIRHAADTQKRAGVALLVDGRSIPASAADKVIAAGAEFGTVLIRRVYGDAAALAGWQADPRFTSQRTSATEDQTPPEIALVIDALDLASSSRVAAFVIVSASAALAPLVRRLQSEGLSVIGLGPQDAPQTFREACCNFRTVN